VVLIIIKKEDTKNKQNKKDTEKNYRRRFRLVEYDGRYSSSASASV